MFDFSSPSHGLGYVDVDCSTVGCNSRVTVPQIMNSNTCVDCYSCMEMKPRDGLCETANGTPISNLKQIKPHYKWNWKLGKAVRV